MPCFYLTPEQDDFNQELQICIAEALYDVDSIVADPGAYTKEELASLHSQIVSNLEWAWELSGGEIRRKAVSCVDLPDLTGLLEDGDDEGEPTSPHDLKFHNPKI